MRQELHNIEYIERYLENALSPADKRKFERHLKEDVQFRIAVNMQRQLVEQVKEQAFLQEIAQQHVSFIGEEQQQGKRFLWLLPFGSLILLAAISIWFFQQQMQPTPPPVSTEKLIEETPTPPNLDLGLAPEELASARQTEYIIVPLSANRTSTVKFKGTASVLTIPKRALVNADGKVVKGSYELQYRALDNPANMALAGFPLLVQGSDAEGIASVGAFELRAFQEGAPLFLAPNQTLILDYELKERTHQVNLYYLDKANKAWTTCDQKLVLPRRGAYDEVVDTNAYQEATRIYEASIRAVNPEQPKRRKDTLDVGNFVIMPNRLEKLSSETPPQPNQYLVRHYKNPKLVRALRLRSFGAYNCGKAYKVPNQVAVAAEYTDLQKATIEGAQTLSVIDLDYNAAYSFMPDQFICDGKANNLFLLWTQEGGVYSFVKSNKVNLQTGTYSFQMEDITERITTSQSLKTYLERLKEKVN